MSDLFDPQPPPDDDTFDWDAWIETFELEEYPERWIMEADVAS